MDPTFMVFSMSPLFCLPSSTHQFCHFLPRWFPRVFPKPLYIPLTQAHSHVFLSVTGLEWRKTSDRFSNIQKTGHQATTLLNAHPPTIARVLNRKVNSEIFMFYAHFEQFFCKFQENSSYTNITQT